ncbi:FecR family protein [Massilia sp. TWR1-2-2]|uniref:FecR family protein n=1 Tax=Massilia sp. TWR1-2-2 TaxID=2804584 RepID=UPI003CEB4F22
MLRHLIIIASLAASAQLVDAAEAGKVIYVAGNAAVADRAAALGSAVQEGDMLTTGADGYVYVKTVDNGLFILRPNTRARIAAYHVDKANPANTRIKLELISGVARSRSGEAVKLARQNFRFNTPVAAIGVRGTDFTVFTDQDTSRVAVISGGITVSGFAGACLPEGNGPCEGGAARELSASQKGQLLQIQRGKVPQLLQGGSLSPDVTAPPRADEPIAKTAGSVGSSPSEPSLDPKKSENLLLVGAQVPPVTPPPAPTTPPPPAPTPDPLPPSTTPPVVEIGVPTPPPVIEPGREISWGRFQPVLGLAPTSAIRKDGAERIAFNEYFVLFRDAAGTPYVAPEKGEVGFTLKVSQAFVRDMNSQVVTLAKLENGELRVDFGSRGFTTSFDLLTSDAERFKMRAEGEVSSDGRLYGNSQFQKPTNMTVNGVLGPNNDATYLFNGNIDVSRIASGVTYWK